MPKTPVEKGTRPGRRALILGGAALAVGGAAAYSRLHHASPVRPASYDDDVAALGWGALESPVHRLVSTKDGAQLAVWDVGDTNAPVVVLPHCWGCTHAVWIPVARRLLEAGNRVVLYDQRGHGQSGRGTAPLTIEGLGNDLATVLEACKIKDAVLAGHSMGGMTIMSLATYQPELLKAHAKALVLVATAAAQTSNGRGFAPAERVAAGVIGSPYLSRLMQSPKSHRYVRGVFGADPVLAQMQLTARLFGETDGAVRGGYLGPMVRMNLVQGIANIDLPTTVMVGDRDRLTLPARADQIVSAIPGARLVTLKDRGHMLPFEDPDAVADEIIRAVKG